MLPSATLTYNLGSAYYVWNVAQLNQCVFGSIMGMFTDSVLYTRSIDNSSLVFKAWDNDTDTHVECAKLLSASEPRFEFSRAGTILPAVTRTYDIGSPSKFWHGACINTVSAGEAAGSGGGLYCEKGEMEVGSDGNDVPVYFGNPVHADYLMYDQANDRWVFYIGGNAVGYVDGTGFHNGSP